MKWKIIQSDFASPWCLDALLRIRPVMKVNMMMKKGEILMLDCGQIGLIKKDV